MKTLQRGEILRFTGTGAEIEVKDGCVWVTQDRDPADSALVEIRLLGVAA